MPETPGKESVLDLLKQIHEGQLVIPYFQRDFEWQPGMVCDLIESILQDYFTGLLLFWELDQNEAKNDTWDPVWGAKLKNHPKIAILDGQQRLSSLYYAIYNPEKTFPNRASYYVFWIDLTKVLNDEIDGSLSYRYYLANHQNWSKLISNMDRWTETGLVPLNILSATSPDDPEREFIKSRKFNEWCEVYIETNKEKLPQHITPFDVHEVFYKIADYKFVTFPLKQDRKLHDICNIFARVNSKGMKLSTFDLMNAFLYSKGVHLRKVLWDDLDNEPLKNIDSSMNEHLLRTMSLVKQNYCSSKYLFNLIPGEKTTRKDEYGKKYDDVLVKNGDEFVSLWKKACLFAEKAREKIMNTGEFEFGAIRHDYIPNTTIVPPLAAILWQYNEKGDLQDRDFNINLKKWYWSAVLSEDYSGSSDSVMAKDFRDWMLWIDENTQIERINRITPEFISELNLQDVKKGSARYSAILCILSLNGAEDFYKYRGVGSGDYIHGKIQDHHIFPSKVQGLPSEKSTEFKSSKDSIVNRTLLLDETNTKINNRKPSEYLAEIKAKLGADKIKPIMESHFINEKALECMWNDDFDGFIRVREKEIKAQLIRVLGLENTSQED